MELNEGWRKVVMEDGTRCSLYIALLHYPVYNRRGEEVTSAVTNLDIHDIARLARTYGLDGYFIVNPDREQQSIVRKICSHWLEGYGSGYNYERGSALSLVELADSLKEVVITIERKHGTCPVTIATSAAVKDSLRGKTVSFGEARKMLSGGNAPHLLILGTGWGLSEDIMNEADYMLAPVSGRGGYNHLSVRSAAAIVVDRLLGNFND